MRSTFSYNDRKQQFYYNKVYQNIYLEFSQNNFTLIHNFSLHIHHQFEDKHENKNFNLWEYGTVKFIRETGKITTNKV